MTDDRWIPVSERLPEDSRKVLICLENNELTFGRHLKADPDGKSNWIIPHSKMNAITHWMPLPEGPE